MHDYDQLMRRWFDEVWNQKRAEVIAEMMAADGVGYGLGDKPEGIPGIEEFQALHRQFCGAFPDLRVEVGDVIVDGDRSVARLTLTEPTAATTSGSRQRDVPCTSPESYSCAGRAGKSSRAGTSSTSKR